MSDLVPDDWCELKLKDISSLITKGTTPKKYTSEGVNFVKVESVTKNSALIPSKFAHIDTLTHESLKRSQLHDGDILFSIAGSLGRLAVINSNHLPANTNQAFAIIRLTKDSIDTTFCVQQLKGETVQLELKKLQTVGAQPNLSLQQVSDILLKTPPLPEQQKIAKILTSVDEVIDKTQAQIDKLKDLKTGMMQELLTQGIGHTEYKDSPVGIIPAEWDCVQLETLLANTKYPMRSGPFGSALLKHELVPSGYPYLGIDNVHVERFEKYYKRFVDDKKFNQLKRYSVFEGDVMITIMGTVGRSCVVPDGIGKALSSKHVWTMTFDTNKYLSNLICWQLNYSTWVENQFKNESQGGVMESISSKTLKQLWLPLPPINEQIKMSKAHVGISKLIESKTNKLNSTISIKKALMQDLLTGKVRVNTAQATPEVAVN